jgi:putative ABC transport system substrate-binding protein
MRLIGLAVVLALSLALAPLAVEGQPAGKVYRIGYLTPNVPNPVESTWLRGFVEAARTLGYSEGANFIFEQRYAGDRLDRLPALARELVSLRLDVIMTFATPASLAAKAATGTIPIVMVAVGDPLGVGLVRSLNRPEGNITGLALNNVESAEKRLQFLTEAVPKLSRVAMLANQRNPAFTALHLAQTRKVAERMNIAVELVELTDPDRLADAFTVMMKQQAGGVIVLPDPAFIVHRERIAQLALQYRLPSVAQDSAICR